MEHRKISAQEHDRLADLQSLLSADTARAYDGAGSAYEAYADGDTADLFRFDGHLAFADCELWGRLDKILCHIAESGRHDLRVLDAGCGPGTWLRRIVVRARELGFTSIAVSGIDVCAAFIERAWAHFATDAACSVRIHLAVGDLNEPLPFDDGAFDITLCLFGVLNHLSKEAREQLAAELGRVTAGHVLATVRSAGSQPTIYVDDVRHAHKFRQDNVSDWMTVLLSNGRSFGFPSHLFTAGELAGLFRPHLKCLSLSGLDLFHSRFAAEPLWNPAGITGQAFDERLTHLERLYASDPDLIDHATHILLIGETDARLSEHHPIERNRSVG